MHSMPDRDRHGGKQARIKGSSAQGVRWGCSFTYGGQEASPVMQHLTRDLKLPQSSRQEGVLEEQRRGQHGWSTECQETWQDRQGLESGSAGGRF